MHDPRLTPARPDLAAKYLEGKVYAQRFVDGEAWEVAAATADVREQPAGDAMLSTQALRGESVVIYDRNDGWAWGQLHDDGYVGWLPESALMKPTARPTHQVTALRTFAFPGTSIKLPPCATLVMGSRIRVVREGDGFVVTPEGWYLPHAHVGPPGPFASDFVAVAERFVGTPYLWGGKSSLGIDCSGLVQISLTAAGTGCPRDSDMQRDSLGRPLPPSESAKLQRGDLLFWKGHVAIARDARTIVHANAHHMATVIENTTDAIERIAKAGNELVVVKRL